MTIKFRNNKAKEVLKSKMIREKNPARFADINVEREDTLVLKKIINQTMHTVTINITFIANKIPINEANPLPPWKFLIHIGKIWPTRIEVEDRMIKSSFTILQIDIAINAFVKSKKSVSPAAK